MNLLVRVLEDEDERAQLERPPALAKYSSNRWIGYQRQREQWAVYRPASNRQENELGGGSERRCAGPAERTLGEKRSGQRAFGQPPAEVGRAEESLTWRQQQPDHSLGHGPRSSPSLSPGTRLHALFPPLITQYSLSFHSFLCQQSIQGDST